MEAARVSDADSTLWSRPSRIREVPNHTAEPAVDQVPQLPLSCDRPGSQGCEEPAAAHQATGGDLGPVEVGLEVDQLQHSTSGNGVPAGAEGWRLSGLLQDPAGRVVATDDRSLQRWLLLMVSVTRGRCHRVER
jgi:hypothetical protein